MSRKDPHVALLQAEIRRTRKRAGLTSRSLTADLEALGWNLDYRQSSRIALTLEALIGELAALYELASANKSVPTDRDGRSGVLAHEMPMPSFTPAAAARELEGAEKRLWVEYEKLSVRAYRLASLGDDGERLGFVMRLAHHLAVELVPEVVSVFDLDDVVDVNHVGEAHVAGAVGDNADGPVSSDDPGSLFLPPARLVAGIGHHDTGRLRSAPTKSRPPHGSSAGT